MDAQCLREGSSGAVRTGGTEGRLRQARELRRARRQASARPWERASKLPMGYPKTTGFDPWVWVILLPDP